MICLKNRTFAVSQTTPNSEISEKFVLWFAWKIVLLQYRKQRLFDVKPTVHVVICLKNRTFAVSQTTLSIYFKTFCLLWFAWKIVLLQYRKQHAFLTEEEYNRCDLLEKSYFCSIANNVNKKISDLETVVICLKNRTFAVSQTTNLYKVIMRSGCDLLEKSYFCSIANNSCSLAWQAYALWFAWKIVLLQYRKQLSQSHTPSLTRCDLLEKSYFCSIANNIFNRVRPQS